MFAPIRALRRFLLRIPTHHDKRPTANLMALAPTLRRGSKPCPDGGGILTLQRHQAWPPERPRWRSHAGAWERANPRVNSYPFASFVVFVSGAHGISSGSHAPAWEQALSRRRRDLDAPASPSLAAGAAEVAFPRWSMGTSKPACEFVPFRVFRGFCFRRPRNFIWLPRSGVGAGLVPTEEGS